MLTKNSFESIYPNITRWVNEYKRIEIGQDECSQSFNKVGEVQTLNDLSKYLRGITLDSLIKELKSKGFTQKTFAESIGMNPRHLASVKSSELRNRLYNELGATKLACLWVLEHCNEGSTK